MLRKVRVMDHWSLQHPNLQTMFDFDWTLLLVQVVVTYVYKKNTLWITLFVVVLLYAMDSLNNTITFHKIRYDVDDILPFALFKLNHLFQTLYWNFSSIVTIFFNSRFSSTTLLNTFFLHRTKHYVEIHSMSCLITLWKAFLIKKSAFCLFSCAIVKSIFLDVITTYKSCWLLFCKRDKIQNANRKTVRHGLKRLCRLILPSFSVCGLYLSLFHFYIIISSSQILFWSKCHFTTLLLCLLCVVFFLFYYLLTQCVVLHTAQYTLTLTTFFYIMSSNIFNKLSSLCEKLST